jgi:mono/diheme cytochrome c family protein
MVVAFVVSAGLSAADDAAVQRGKELFGTQGCKLCHSIAGQGNPKGPLDEVGKLDAKQIRAWLVTPTDMAAKAKAQRKPPMKSFDKLPPADLDALVAYLGTLKKG